MSVQQAYTGIDAFLAHDTASRRAHITVPALVLAGGLNMITPAALRSRRRRCHPGAPFEVLAEEAHQPSQDLPDLFNAAVDAFWRRAKEREL